MLVEVLLELLSSFLGDVVGGISIATGHLVVESTTIGDIALSDHGARYLRKLYELVVRDVEDGKSSQGLSIGAKSVPACRIE